MKFVIAWFLSLILSFSSGGINAGASAKPGEDPSGRVAQSSSVDNRSKTTVDSDSSTDDKSMPVNPAVPLPQKISSSIPDDATVVSPDLAVTRTGVVKNIVTGKRVTNNLLVGSSGKQPDPLAKTNGRRFIPVKASTLKAASRKSSAGEGAVAKYAAKVRNARYNNISGNVNTTELVDARASGDDYGVYWGSYAGERAFFENGGRLFAQQARLVIDVSGWQPNINWQEVKDSGVQGVIIRISYGWGNSIDSSAIYNINACKRLGIPFGLYVYSYAANGYQGGLEATDVLAKLHQAGVQSTDLSYPIYYDLEYWTDGNRTPPTSSSTYDEIVDSWYSGMKSGGYSNLSVYSYTSYLSGPLNTTSIHARTGWVASYGPKSGFDYQNNFRGWQYWDQGTVSGISGNVDLSVFGNKTYMDDDPSGSDPSTIPATLFDLAEGDYYLVSSYSNEVADIAWASKSDAAIAEIWQYTGGSNQVFHIYPLGNHRYAIIAKHSQKALDVFGGHSRNGASIIQFDQTNATNQQWQIYRTSSGKYIFKSMADSSKNRVLDITSGKSSDGTKLELWGLNGGINQQFRLVKVGDYLPGAAGWTTVDGISYWYADGVRATSQEFLDSASGNWYYFDSDGRKVSGWYAIPDGRYVYYDPVTNAMVHGERRIDGYWYYFDGTGNITRNHDVWLGGETKWVRYDASGHMVYGENFHDGGWYYFDPVTGAMSKGWKYLTYDSGKLVYYDEITGQMHHGELCIAGDWYYFDDTTGAVIYGWKLLSGGRWVYYNQNDGKMLKGWHTVNGKLRHFDEITGGVTN